MMNPTLAAALLQTSITGAGLVFAVFAIVLPLLKEIQTMQEQKAKSILQDISEKLKSAKDSDKTKISQIQKIMSDKEGELELPFSSEALILSTFILYLLSGIGAYMYLDSNPVIMGVADFVGFGFVIATVIFMILGVSVLKTITAILSVYKLTKED